MGIFIEQLEATAERSVAALSDVEPMLEKLNVRLKPEYFNVQFDALGVTVHLSPPSAMPKQVAADMLAEMLPGWNVSAPENPDYHWARAETRRPGSGVTVFIFSRA